MAKKKSLKSRIKGKVLFIESCEFQSKIQFSKELKEAVSLSNGKAGTLLVKNVPTTILNRENMNGRIYTTEVMQEAINDAKDDFTKKALLSQACEHPESSFCSPTTASHVVVNSYIKKDVDLVVEGEEGTFDVLFQDWEVLNTREGKDLRALLEAECSIGTSIRGVGDMDGKYVSDYVLLGCDVVGNPSSGTFTRMPVSESVSVEFKKGNVVKENFNITTSSTNVVRDLEAAAQIQERLDSIGYGTVTKTSTKVDQETDAKTGAMTSITTLEAETSDDVSTIDQAMSMAKNAMLNKFVNVDSVTIENLKDLDGKESYEPLSNEEEILQEAKKNEAEKNVGKKFVLKGPAGYVGMEGNALIFIDNPKEALHFVDGKEESGLVHLSGVEKILDAMGVFEVEKHYQKTVTNLGSEEKTIDIEEDSTETPVKENNTMYSAIVSIIDNEGNIEKNTVALSATTQEGLLSEVDNLFTLKSDNNEGKVNIDIKDNNSNKIYFYDPSKGTINIKESSTNDTIKQDGETLSVKIDDEHTVSKTFDDEIKANLAKTGIENDKLSTEILLNETDAEEDFDLFALNNEEELIEEDIKNDIPAGWYISIPSEHFLDGPYKNKEEAENTFTSVFEDSDEETINSYFEDTNREEVFLINFDKEGNKLQSFSLNEKLFDAPDDASDPFIQHPIID